MMEINCGCPGGQFIVGHTGVPGPKGDKGETGATGPGVVAGGLTGQVLAKKSNADYDTEWVTGGGGGAAVWGGITGTLSNQTDLNDALTAKYVKPDAGIPLTDLAEAVQTSLGKADTAQQPKTSLAGYGITDAKIVDGTILLGTETITPLTQHQSLDAYRTSANQDVIDAGKQATLESGINIKTVNGNTLLGSGDIEISSAVAWGNITGTILNQTDLQSALDLKANFSEVHNMSAGGSPGQILAKNSATDYDTHWINPSAASVSIDGKTIVRNANEELATGIGGYQLDLPETIVINSVFTMNEGRLYADLDNWGALSYGVDNIPCVCSGYWTDTTERHEISGNYTLRTSDGITYTCTLDEATSVAVVFYGPDYEEAALRNKAMMKFENQVAADINCTVVQQTYTSPMNVNVIPVDGTSIIVNDHGELQATGEANVLEGVQVNGDELITTDKKVNVQISEGSSNGTIAANGHDVPVHGLGSAAYTESTAYATSEQGAKADTALQSVPDTYRTAAAQDVIDATKASAQDLTTHVGNTDIHTTSTDKVYWNAKYDKPAAGIPKVDLNSDVQTSLDKADTALQSVPDTYRTAAAQDVIDATKQSTDNLVTSVSSTSSDTQYPSARCLYTLCGDIEATLRAIRGV